MKRRDFLKFGSCGLAAVAVGGAGGWNLFGTGALAFAHEGHLHLTMVEVEHEMVDGVLVPAWAFRSDLLAADGVTPLGPRIPGPVIFATEGETVRIRVRNELNRGGDHAFAVIAGGDSPGNLTFVPGSETGPLNKDDEVEVAFTAPAPGTYLYLDPLNAPVNRVMGLYGALVVLPSPIGFNTPYSNPTANVQRLFDDLGTTTHFPGHPWDPDRNAVWVFSVIDPVKHALAADRSNPITPATFLSGYLPQYFMINGKSGFFAAQHGEAGGTHDHERSPDAQASISIHGNVGQPCLIRNLNAGLMWNSPHIHGNHVYLISENNKVLGNLQMIDTWTMEPLARKDLLLPYIAPPDIPPGFWERAAAGTNEELFPLLFPMHDHNEISNTAAGGNYPQGLATHFQFDGPIDPADEVIQVDRAELRLRTGEFFLAGRSSGSPGNQLSVHAGPDDTGPTIGTTTVQGDGTWSVRGRGLKAVASRRVTVHNHATGAERRNIPLKLR